MHQQTAIVLVIGMLLAGCRHTDTSTALKDVTTQAVCESRAALDPVKKNMFDAFVTQAFRRHAHEVYGDTSCEQITNKLNTLNMIGLGEGDEGPVDAAFLEHLPSLAFVSFVVGTTIANVDRLATFEQLRSVTFTNMGPPKAMPPELIQSLIPISRLEHLSIINFKLADISFITRLSVLTNLVLTSSEVSDLSPLDDAPQLRHLVLDSLGLTNIDFVQDMLDLETLSLNFNDLRNLTPLLNCANLRFLSLRNNPNLTNILAVQHLPNLVRLDLGGATVSNLDPLRSLTALDSLDLSYNGVSDLSPLANSRISELQLQNNHITDITPLTTMSRLVFINASNNELTQLPNFPVDAPLHSFVAGGNEITDIAPIARLPNIKLLDVNHNRIQRLPRFADDTLLDTLRVEGNPITDYCNAMAAPQLRSLVYSAPGDRFQDVPRSEFASVFASCF